MSYPLFQTALLGEGLGLCCFSQYWVGGGSGQIFRTSSGVQAELQCLSQPVKTVGDHGLS